MWEQALTPAWESPLQDCWGWVPWKVLGSVPMGLGVRQPHGAPAVSYQMPHTWRLDVGQAAPQQLEAIS